MNTMKQLKLAYNQYRREHPENVNPSGTTKDHKLYVAWYLKTFGRFNKSK
jgi:hypothetical protein